MWLVVLMIFATFTRRIIKSYEDVLRSVVEYTGGGMPEHSFQQQ